VIDTGDGAKQTFELTGHASEPAGKDAPKRTANGSKVPDNTLRTHLKKSPLL
jgi:hypothetical protein